ncbi:hypothetical protein [Aeromonas caviae]|uniref:hypothetical protein n=1 Tax=Aeromonas caviae TaxID=648 RepID=UPI0029D756BE|nr:hypothetical protein [Aeromonas caviae]MDX7810925.1 hypothetical protein [Aeromonas caviae]
MPIDLGGGSGGGFYLPSPPAKAAKNTTDFTVAYPTGFNSGRNGKFRFSYQFWDVSDAIPLHTFGLTTGDAAWGPSVGMALRNDTTGLTVWAKPYSDFGSSGPHGAAFDLAAGYLYLLTANQPTSQLRLWRIRLSDGQANLLGSASSSLVPSYPFGVSGSSPMMFARFNASGDIEFVYMAGTNSAYAGTVTISGVFSKATPITPWGAILISETYEAPSSSSGSSIQYVTRDRRAAVCFMRTNLLNLPTAPISADSGDRGSIRVCGIFRGFGRTVMQIVDPSYHIPFRADDYPISSTAAQLFVTDKAGDIAMLREKTQYIPAWDGRHDFYTQADFDRWVHEIANRAGLPEGTPMW